MINFQNLFENIVTNYRNKSVSYDYYYDNRVSDIAIHAITSTSFAVNGLVDGSDLEEVSCSIDVDTKQHKVSYHCECDFNTEKSCCGHIGAVLLELDGLDPKSFPFYYNRDAGTHRSRVQSQPSRDFGGFDYLKNHHEYMEKVERTQRQNRGKSLFEKMEKSRFAKLDVVSEGNSIELVPSLVIDERSYYTAFTIEYRIGNDKLYVVKNLNTLLTKIQTESVGKYGKFLEFKHTLGSFTDFARQQIDFILKCNPEHDLGREITISESNLDAIRELYFERSRLPRVEYQRLDNKKVLVEVTKENDSYIFSADIDEVFLTEEGIYTLELDQEILGVTFIAFDNRGGAYEFLKELRRGDVEVSSNLFESFKEVVLSAVSSDIEWVYLDESLEKEVEVETYAVSTYIDLDDQHRIYAYADAVSEDGKKLRSYQTVEKPFELACVEYVLNRYVPDINHNTGFAYFDDSSDLTFDFLGEGINQLNDLSDVYISEAIRNLNIKRRYAIQAGVRINAGLLQIDFTSDVVSKDEFKDVLNAYRLRKKFYKLKNGEVINLESEELQAVHDVLDQYHVSLNDVKSGEVMMPLYRALDLERYAEGQEEITFDFDGQSQKIAEGIRNLSESPIQIKTPLKAYLRPYQEEGVKWMLALTQLGFGGILADDMGLGKTLQFLSYIDNMKRDKPSIVVCPASVVLNWMDEVAKFAPHMKSLAVTGTRKERELRIQTIQNYDLIITSYDYLRNDIEDYQGIEFDTVALDEAQYIKNHNTQNARATKKLQSSHKLALTGTPIENSLSELWSIFDFVMPGYLFNYHYFSKRFEKPIIKEQDKEAHARLKELVSPFILRRLKQNVLEELPDKVEEEVLLDFSEDERKLYLANLAQINDQFKMGGSDGVDKIAILAMLTRLRQICCDPSVVYDNFEGPSTKMMACLGLVQSHKEQGKKVLVFSSFTTMLSNLQSLFDKNGIKSKIFEGKTDKATRRKMVSEFDTDDTDVLLISLKAGGTGINLTSAQAVIHFDPWWNVSAQNQATDRAHRFGQTKNVTVYQLIVKDTVEQRIVNLQMQKKEISDHFVDGSQGSISSMSFDEIRDLFKTE